MKACLDWGIEVVLWFQQFSPALDLPFKALTMTGNEPFFMLLIPLVYWCINRRLGARLAVLFLFSTYINNVAKALAGQPRPYQYDPRVKQLTRAGGGGLPSGHTQNAVVVWGYLASQIRRTWAWVAAIALMILVPLSRVYLGAHFPTDLLGGYLLGAVVLFLFLRFGSLVETHVARLPWPVQVAVAVLGSLGLLLLAPKGEPHCLVAAATMMGMTVGIALERRFVRFECGGNLLDRATRFCAGAAVLFALMFVLRTAFRSLAPESLYRVIRYAVIGLWCTFGAPWLFLKLRLASQGASR
jgi:membrane-associated phospholipid phosphatase